MNLTARIQTGIAVLATAIFSAPVATAQETFHGRVSFAENDGLVKGAQDDDWSYATINSLVLAGDSVWADNQGVLELEFSGGTFVRLADGSKLDVVGVPPNSVLRGWHGSFYVQRVRRGAGDVLFETPVGNISVDQNTQVRIDILSEGQTTVTVRWGRAVVGADTGQAVSLTQGQRTYIDPGYSPSVPVAFDRSLEDSFDEWNRDRARLLAVGTENVPILDDASYESAPVGVADLNSYGEWVYADDDYYWRPTVINNYIPYRDGYWGYGRDYGYSWVEPYPFSYVTTHYGYWDHHHRYGWIWKYNRHYRHAYAATLHYGNHFIWSPLGFHGHPVHYGHDFFTVGGVQFSILGSSYSLTSHLLGGHGYRGHHGRYSHGLNRNYFNGIHADNINIWNINLGGGRYSDSTYTGSTLPVRNYTPQRSLRGPVALQSGSSARLASARAATLEAGTRSQFRATGNSSARTGSARATTLRTQAPGADSARNARVRTASVRSSATAETTRALRHAERTNAATRGLVSRGSGEINTLTNADVRSSDRVRNIATRAPRSTATTRSVRGTDSTVQRGTAQRGDAGARTAPSATSRDTGRSVVPGRTETRTVDSRTPRTTRESAITAPRESVRTTQPRATTRSAERPTARSTRSTVPQGSFDSALPRSAPTDARSSGSRINTNSRSTVRSESTTRNVRSTAPSRSATESVRNTAPTRSVERAAPSTRSVQRSAPSSRSSVQRSAPSSRSSVQRSTPSRSSVQRSAPSRNTPSRVTSPSRSTSRSTVSRPSTPSRSSGISSGRTSRISSPSRSVSRPSAPSRSSGISSSRSIAPSRGATVSRGSSGITSRSSGISSRSSSGISSRSSGVSSRATGASRGVSSRSGVRR